jgi:C4-dicarboxylate-specific signal transduction histidine kinase
MVEVKVNRNSSKIGSDILIESNISEKLSQEEFDEVYGQKLQEQSNLDAQINHLKSQLKKLGTMPEETEDVKKIKELMQKASALLKIESVQNELQRLERTKAELDRDLKAFNKIQIQI